MGDQHLRAGVRRADRERRPAGGHVRPPADLLHRRGGLRALLRPGRPGAGRSLADRLPGADGHRRGDDVAGGARNDLRHPPRGQGGAGGRADHRRGRLRQRRRAAARRRAGRAAQLARDPVGEPPGGGGGLLRHLAGGPRVQGRHGSRAHRLPGDHHADRGPDGAAVRAGSGDRMGLDRRPHPGPVRAVRRAAGGLRGDRAPRRLERAHPRRRDAQRRSFGPPAWPPS